MGGTNTFLLTETIHQRLNSKHYLDLAGPLVCNFCEKLLDVGDMVTEMKQMYEEGIITCYVSPKGHLIFQNGPPDKTRDWKTK
jgi:hypothetical protein